MSLAGEKAVFNYGETDLLQILELPYDGDEVSMLLLLPKKDDISSLEASLRKENLASWENAMNEEQVNVFLPRFKFETKYLMADTLMEMGITYGILLGCRLLRHDRQKGPLHQRRNTPSLRRSQRRRNRSRRSNGSGDETSSRRAKPYKDVLRRPPIHLHNTGQEDRNHPVHGEGERSDEIGLIFFSLFLIPFPLLPPVVGLLHTSLRIRSF